MCRYGGEYDRRSQADYCVDNEGTYMIMFNPEIIKNQDRMMQKKVVFLCSEAPANANAIQTIKAQRKIAEFKNLTKSFFGWTVQIIRMKSTIAMVF